MTTTEQIKQDAEAIKDKVIARRRDFHEHPELAFEEVRTAGIVAQALGELGYEVQQGVGKTGVVGLMEGGQPGDQVLLIRFDMDALPVNEEVDVPFKSQTPGKMHACGHDAHTAIGLGVAELLAKHRNSWAGTAKFVFQPAEEIVGGALAMIKDGVLEGPKPTRSLSMHVASNLEVGKIIMPDGPMMAAADAFSITVRGRGTHGASPHLGADPIYAAAQIITALQSIVSRQVDPVDTAVVTIGAIHAGTAGNVVPDVVEMSGTLRAFKEETSLFLRKRVQEVAEGVAKSLGVEAVVSYPNAINPPTVNNHDMAELVRAKARELVGADNVIDAFRTMGAEDCAHFLKAAPGAYAFVGAGNKAKGYTEPHHSPRFAIDEDSFPTSVALVTASAMEMLK
ncbi:MAG TPA: amidohydrolase [Thermoflexales bacterium]|nr:amidohydrolase [Thermoflexales bacterium]